MKSISRTIPLRRVCARWSRAARAEAWGSSKKPIVVKGTTMQIKSNWARRGLSFATAAGLTASLIIAMPKAASADETVIDFTSTTRGDYTALAPFGGGGGTNWNPWPDADNLNATGISGATNWTAREGWTGKNFVVQDDGSGTNNALWVHKAQAAAASNGVTVVKVTSSETMITSADKVITMKFKAADAGVVVHAVLSDFNGANAIKTSATATTAGAYNTLTFDFGTLAEGTYSSDRAYAILSIIPDPELAAAGVGHEDWGQSTNSATNSKLYLVDDITFTTSDATPPPPPTADPVKLTFEDDDSVGAGAYGEPSGDKLTGSFNQNLTGQNTPPVARTGKALEFAKAAGAAEYAGFIVYAAPAGKLMTDADHKIISFDMYSPDRSPSPVQVKLELGSDAAVKTFAVKKGWNVVRWDVSTMENYNSAIAYQKLIIIPDFGTAAGATLAPRTGQKYYFDNIIINVNPAVKTASNGISGTAKVGKTLTASTGTWTGTNVTYSYQWYRCTVKGSSVRSSAPSKSDKCTAISRKTSSTYKLSSSDRGKYVRVVVKATTMLGTVYSTSKSTSRVG